MKKINILPRFMPGQVIDMSYKHSKSLPNRILIKSIFIREQDNQWMYEVFIESTGECSVLNEGFIKTNMSHRDAKVYLCSDVIKLYNDGWRFCGNYEKDEAHTIASKHATSRYIKGIILRPALNYNGCLINGKYGMWVKYHNIINSDGTIGADTDNKDVIIIK